MAHRTRPSANGRRALLLPCLAAGLPARPARAQQKLAKEMILYRDHPNGDQRCDNCIQWQPPDACAIVEGTIAPQGWCAAWAPKA